jgi:hypothetical protein
LKPFFCLSGHSLKTIRKPKVAVHCKIILEIEEIRLLKASGQELHSFLQLLTVWKWLFCPLFSYKLCNVMELQHHERIIDLKTQFVIGLLNRICKHYNDLFWMSFVLIRFKKTRQKKVSWLAAVSHIDCNNFYFIGPNWYKRVQADQYPKCNTCN